MQQTSQTRRYVNDANDLYIEFSNELEEPFGTVQVRAEQLGDKVVCRAHWGGWNWRAEGGDRVAAQKRLNDRLLRLDPFEHSEADWGHPGYQTGALDDAIPPRTRQRMRDYTQREARRAVGLLEAIFEVQARRPWAFPNERDEVLVGVEIEGFVRADGALALFPQTFYEIAGSYFGRNASTEELEARADNPGLVGALRRLTEQGFMRTEECHLRHQLTAVTVYVFTPQSRTARRVDLDSRTSASRLSVPLVRGPR